MPEDNKLSDSDGAVLVKTARKAVTEFLSNGNKIKLEPEFEKKFSFNSGVFVTLNKTDGLRGCIGFPMPVKKLSRAIVDGAIAAATEDPRFSPVTTKELGDIVFEVTVLTHPIEIDVSDPAEYLSKIKVGRDGLIISHSFYSGLLLPQVPGEYGWNDRRSKIENIMHFPYERTLFLDSDTIVDYKLDDMFELLDTFDLAMVHDLARKRKYVS